MELKKNLINLYTSSSEIYNERYQEIQFKKYSFINSKIDFIKATLIVDLGGGTGLLRKFLPKNVKSILVELCPAMIKQLIDFELEKPKFDIIADIENLPIRRMALPFIVGFSILQNIERPTDFVNYIIREYPNTSLIFSGIKKSEKYKNLLEKVKDVKLNKETQNELEDVFFYYNAEERS